MQYEFLTSEPRKIPSSIIQVIGPGPDTHTIDINCSGDVSQHRTWPRCFLEVPQLGCCGHC